MDGRWVAVDGCSRTCSSNRRAWSHDVFSVAVTQKCDCNRPFSLASIARMMAMRRTHKTEQDLGLVLSLSSSACIFLPLPTSVHVVSYALPLLCMIGIGLIAHAVYRSADGPLRTRRSLPQVTNPLLWQGRDRDVTGKHRRFEDEF